MRYDPHQLLNFLNEKWVNKKCQICGEKNWSIDNKVFKVTDVKNDGTGLIPVVPILCKNCGNVIFINPMISQSATK